MKRKAIPSSSTQRSSNYISMLRPRPLPPNPVVNKNIQKKWLAILMKCLVDDMGPIVLMTEEEEAWNKDARLTKWSPLKYALLQYKIRRCLEEQYGEDEEEFERVTTK
jgi:hypothetical protein